MLTGHKIVYFDRCEEHLVMHCTYQDADRQPPLAERISQASIPPTGNLALKYQARARAVGGQPSLGVGDPSFGCPDTTPTAQDDSCRVAWRQGPRAPRQNGLSWALFGLAATRMRPLTASVTQNADLAATFREQRAVVAR